MPDTLTWSVKATTAILSIAIGVWVFQPVPLEASSLIILAALLFLKAVPFNEVFIGFSKDSLFILLTGLMIANGVNSTQLGQRIGLYILLIFGSTCKRILLGILISLQLLAFIIPASAVRATLLLPVVLMIINLYEKEGKAENIRRYLTIGLAFGAILSGIGLLPAAVSNPLTTEFIVQSTSYQIYYLEWLCIAYPISILMTVCLWFMLGKVYPPERDKLPGGQSYVRNELNKLGKMTKNEIKCLIILFITFALWTTQKFHHLPVSAPAILAVSLMVLPNIGIIKWDKIIKINWGSILLFGTSLSLGSALKFTGTAGYLADLFLSLETAENVLSNPVFSIIALTLFTQVYHLGFAGVTPCNATLVPLVITAAEKMGVNPIIFGLVTGISSMFGFILVVEALPTIVVFSSGQFEGRDLIKVGFLLTLLSIPVMVAVVFLWWPLLGLTMW
jgi:sodium-dependent dicarboxylate transporter 2/3/5